MAEFIKAAGLAVIGVLFALLLKKNAPELGFLLSLGIVACCLGLLLAIWQPISVFWDELTDMSGLSPQVTLPLLKCVGLAIVTKIAADLCRDAKETAIGTAIELLGTLAGLAVALPLLSAALSLIRELV